MDKEFIIIKSIKDKKILFDAKNMILFDVTNGFDENIYNDIVNSLESDFKITENSLSKVVLNISNVCNYKCVYCYANFGNYGKENAFMEISTLKKIVEDLLSRGIKNIGVVELFGGEATLNINLVEFVNILYNSFNVERFILTTNGSGDEEIVEKLSKYPIKYYVSIDGPETINDILRGDGSYKRAMKFISYLNKYSSSYTVSSTYTKKHEIMGISYDDLYKFAEENKFSIGVNTVISNDKSIIVDKRIDVLELSKEIDRTLDILISGSYGINFDPYVMRILKGLFLGIKTKYFCDDLKMSIHYDYDGSVYNCFKLWSDSRFKLDNIECENEVIKLFNSKENFIRCKKCWAKYLCELCVVETFLGNGKFYFLENECDKKFRFEYALEKIFEKIINGDIEKIKNNFINYLI